MRSNYRMAAALALLSVPAGTAPLCAQRTTDNATTSATDAFGRSIGDEDVGIYDTDNVRGFSPINAGNVRIEGLYFDKQPGLNGRLVEGARVRVGVSALGYPFPAPTGIADFTLRRPGPRPLVSAVLRFGPYGLGSATEIDAQLPLDGERLGLVLGAGVRAVAENYGAAPRADEQAATLVFRPTEGTELLAFWSRQHVHGEAAQPIAFTIAGRLPPRIRRGVFAGQRWSRYDAAGHNLGVIAKVTRGWITWEAGLFRSLGVPAVDFSDLLIGVDETGHAADRLIIADRDIRYASLSGELRGTYRFAEGARHHTLYTSLRGRDTTRIYGGSDLVSLGASRLGIPDFRPEPDLIFGPKSRDTVRQLTGGVGYQIEWRGIGQVQFGLLRTFYRKLVTDLSGTFLAPESRATPWLFNAAGAIELTPRISLYASFSRGLEESPVAPSSAANRNEAPPAILTRQIDAGLRWSIGPGLTLVGGVFQIEKPYFFLDRAALFRQLGVLRNRGVEVSLAGQVAPGLTLVAGSVFLDPRVSGEGVSAGLIGPRPVGSMKRNSIISLDYRFPRWPDLSIDALIESTGRRYGPNVVVPSRTVLSLGWRYRFTIGRARLLLRAQIGNVFNTYGYIPLSSGGFVYNEQRHISVSLAADF